MDSYQVQPSRHTPIMRAITTSYACSEAHGQDAHNRSERRVGAQRACAGCHEAFRPLRAPVTRLLAATVAAERRRRTQGAPLTRPPRCTAHPCEATATDAEMTIRSSGAATGQADESRAAGSSDLQRGTRQAWKL